MNFYEGVARIVMERYNVTTFDGLVDALGIETTWTRICRVMVAEKIFERDEKKGNSPLTVADGVV